VVRSSTTPFTGGAGGSAAGGGGPRAASTSRRTLSTLPEARGASTAARGDGEFRAPPHAGPLRVRAPEVPEVVRIASLFLGVPMQRGSPAPGVHWARIFALFPLPGGRPRRFTPELGPAAAAELEGSMSSGARKQEWHWRKEVKCRRSRGRSI
jgi:hypothetical protein